jgi:hypothetical protein
MEGELMRRYPTDETLERALAELGTRIAYPPERDLAPDVVARVQTGRAPSGARPYRLRFLRPRTVFAAGVMVLVALALVLVSPTVRTAVARVVVRLPGIRIFYGPTPSPRTTTPGAGPAASPSSIDYGTPTTLDAARAAMPFRILIPASGSVTEPRLYLAPAPAGGAVVMVVPPGPDLPAPPGSDVALVISEFRGTVDQIYLNKVLGPGTRLDAVEVNGHPGFWIEGAPHALFYVDPDGTVQPSYSRLAGNTLLWEQGGTTVRIEGAVSKERALAVATSMR